MCFLTCLAGSTTLCCSSTRSMCSGCHSNCMSPAQRQQQSLQMMRHSSEKREPSCSREFPAYHGLLVLAFSMFAGSLTLHLALGAWHGKASHVTCRRLQPGNPAPAQADAGHAAGGSQLTEAARRTLDTQEQLQVCPHHRVTGRALLGIHRVDAYKVVSCLCRT